MKQGNLTEGTLWREGVSGSKDLLDRAVVRTEEAAYVAANLINNTAEELDSVHFR